MSSIRKLFEHSSSYFIGNILIALAGLISYPVWTRYFSKEDYGTLSIIYTTILFMVAFSKFGLQHAALRFYSDFKDGNRKDDITSYYTTILIGSLCIAGIITAVAYLLTRYAFYNYVNTTIMEFLPLVVIIVLIISINCMLIIFLQAEKRAKACSMFQVAEIYGRLLLGVILVFGFIGNLYGIFLGWTISEGLLLMLFASKLVRQRKINIKKFSLPFLGESIKYGFPLIGFELSQIFLALGDRYLIHYYLGSGAVGVYSAGYALSDMVQSSISMPLRLAAVPMYLSIWNKEGEENTRTFLSQSINYYFLLGMPLAIGLSWFGKDIITLLASSKYQESYTILPFIVFPGIMHGASVIYGAGLYIHKRTAILMYLSLFAGVMNIILNVFLIPAYGIMGAAYATFVSYAFLISMIIYRSNGYFKIKIHLNVLFKYAVLAVFIMFLVSQIHITAGGIIAKIAIVAVLYLSTAFMLDKNIRQHILAHIKILK